MSQVVLPPALKGAATQTAGPVGVPGAITSPPPDLARQPPGHVLKGVALGRDGHGHLLVRTELGVLAVATKANPPAGSEVTLQIRSSGPQLHVMLVRIDAPPYPGDGGLRPLPPAVPSGGSHSGPPLSAGDRLTLSQQIAAQLVSLADPTQLAEAAHRLPLALLRALPLLTSLPLTFTLVAIEQPSGPPAPLPAAPTNAASAATQSATAAASAILPTAASADTLGTLAQPGQAAAAAPTMPPSPGSVAAAPSARPAVPPSTAAAGQMAAPPNPIAPPAPSAVSPVQAGENPRAAVPSHLASYGNLSAATTQPLAASATPLPLAAAENTTWPPALALSTDGRALRISAEVEGHAVGGRPVVVTALGSVTLTNVGALAPGTKLLLELQLATLSLPAEAAGTAKSTKSWSGLAEMLQVVGHQGLAELHPLLRTLPQPGARLASDLLFLISALRGGELSVWPGAQALEGLERAGRADLVSRLGADLAQAARSAEASPGDWRLLTLPFHDGSHLQQLRLYLRRDRTSRRSAVEKATRFVLEVDLTRVGALQLDGLVQPRRFDLMLRSRQALPEIWRQDIAEIFEEANAAVGNSGEIVFQASPDWRPMATTAEATTIQGGLVV
ncbi:MAG: hypothetical protein ACREDZ_12675 [Kiloniellales bacterium]